MARFINGYRIGAYNHTQQHEPRKTYSKADDGNQMITFHDEIMVYGTATPKPKPKIPRFAEKILNIGSHPLVGAAADATEHFSGLRGLSRPFTVMSVTNDTYLYSTGQISQSRFRYRLVSTNIAVGVGHINPVAGMFVGANAYFLEQAYDFSKFLYLETNRFFQPDNLIPRYFMP